MQRLVKAIMGVGANGDHLSGEFVPDNQAASKGLFACGFTFVQVQIGPTDAHLRDAHQYLALGRGRWFWNVIHAQILNAIKSDCFHPDYLVCMFKPALTAASYTTSRRRCL
jgi:hypothetical protein